MLFFKKIKNIAEKIVNQFEPIAEAVLLEGSWAYGSASLSSDLDLEIVVKSFRFLENFDSGGKFPHLVKEISNCLEIIRNSQGIDLLQVKVPILGVPTGIRIIRLKTLQRISKVNLLTLNKDLFLLSIRNKQRQGQSLVYSQRNFEGKIKKFNKRFWVILKKQFTLVPVFLFDRKNHFYPGSMTDRYLCLPKILLDKEGKCQELLREIKISVVSRYLMEKEKFKFSSEAGVFRCLSRWERLPAKIKEELLEEESQLIKIIQTNYETV